MSNAFVEHVNMTVADPLATAELFVALFGWKIRWQGDAIYDGFSVHVGSENSYIALYTRGYIVQPTDDSYTQVRGLNHIGIVVDDIKEIESRVRARGLQPHSHADYEPGQRFYFKNNDELEVEVVSYS